jgi:hypothetical protein
VKSHTVPRFFLDQFAYDDPKTKSRRLWQYAKGRPPSGKASAATATRIEHHFADPADGEREKWLETRLNNEFEDPVHKFLAQMRYRNFVLSPIHIRQLTRYVRLLFNRSRNSGPLIGHTTGTPDPGEIRFYRGLRGVLLILRVSGRNRISKAAWIGDDKPTCRDQ